jgi:hypothetical protein
MMDLSIFFAHPTQCKSTNSTKGAGGFGSSFFSSAFSSGLTSSGFTSSALASSYTLKMNINQ